MYEGPATWLSPKAEEAPCEIRVEFTWAAGTLVSLDFADAEPWLLLEETGTLRLPDGSATDNFVLLDGSTAVLNSWTVGKPDGPLAEVHLHLCNFVPYELVPEFTQPITLSDDRWKVDLWQMDDAPERHRERRRLGGGTITHLAIVRKSDGSDFSWRDVKPVTIGLGHFFTWTASDRVPVLIPIGLDASGDAAFELWGDPVRGLGQSGLRWFSRRHPEMLTATWPRFSEYWARPDWQRALTVASLLYSSAHHGLPLEVRIVLAQSALGGHGLAMANRSMFARP